MSLAHIMIKKADKDQVKQVTRALNALSGVDRAVVDLRNFAISVEFADEIVNLNQLRKTVRAAGITVLSDWKEP